MKSLFKPTAQLMGAMKYQHKFTTLFLVVLIPLIFLSYSMVQRVIDKLEFIEAERIGLIYINDVRFPIEHIQQHRGMTAAYLGGDTHFINRIQEKRKDVDKYLSLLTQRDDAMGVRFETQGTLPKVISQWENIKNNSLKMTLSEAIQLHTNLIADLLDLKTHIADKSNITLDPNLDSYYLGDALVNNLPSLMENMGQARALGSGVAATGSFTQTTYVKLSVLTSNIRTLAKKLRNGLNAASEANEKIHSDLKSSIETNNQAIDNILRLLENDLLNASSISISGKKVFDTATQAIAGSYTLYDSLVPELDHIWASRIKQDQRIKYLELSLVTIVLLLLSYLFAGLLFSTKETIERVSNASQKLADGDLTTRLTLDTKDEMQDIAKNFNIMANNFENAIKQISSSTSQLAASAEEVAAIAQESAQNLGNQRSETEQVASSMSQMANTVQEVANSATDAASAANNADQESNSGKLIVEQAATSIGQLSNEVQHSSEIINQLAKNSEEIGTILVVIKDVAEQTNLLALNAAIEAARAGEQGRGFAVVADEVRTLAGRTQQSTEEIESMIEKLQHGARNAVSAMEKGKEQTTMGVEQTTRAGQALAEITNAVAIINQMNSQIASAAEQQSITANDMHNSIDNIKRLSDETAESAMQSTSSSEELSQLAIDLQELVQKFKIT